MTRWTTWGSVRGQGPVYLTRQDAERCLQDDRRGCRRQGGYSDRHVYLVDDEGYVCDPETEDAVFPSGRSCAALRVSS